MDWMFWVLVVSTAGAIGMVVGLFRLLRQEQRDLLNEERRAREEWSRWWRGER